VQQGTIRGCDVGHRSEAHHVAMSHAFIPARACRPCKGSPLLEGFPKSRLGGTPVCRAPP
jgi:hypothetical protein